MKKLFTLTMLALLLAVGANAQNRKTWDFTKGFSATTIANLQADDKNWTYSESGSSKKWAQSKARTADTEISCTVNGETWIVPETKGLLFGAKTAEHLNVVYQVSSSDETHIWLNGKATEDYVIIPNVPAGETLTVTYSSHSGTEKRGFKVSTSNVADADGNTQFTTVGGQETVVLINKNTDVTNVKLTATNGMHFYKIIIGEGDEEVVSKVAYLYDGNEDHVLTYLKSNDKYEVTPINVTSETVTAEGLQAYDVTVIGASVPADNNAVAIVKETLPWTPFLNLNANLYSAWGYGEAIATDLPMGFVKNTKSTLLADINIEEEDDTKFVTLSNDQLSAIALGDYFAGDDMPLTDISGENAITHTHNITHNGYAYMPATTSGYTEAGATLLENIMGALISSKAETSAAAAPAISIEYKNLNTNITITAPNLPKAEVFYTLDGSTPTINSTKYTGTINVTEETTVKAVAIAEGYTLSAVAEKLVDIKTQPKTPTITCTESEDGTYTTIKIACESAGDDVKVYYNFADPLTTDTLKSNVYSDENPVIVTMPQTVTAFAVAGGSVWSEVAQMRALMKNPRVVIDVAAHFDAPQWTGFSNGGSIFSYGKNGVIMYDGEGTPSTDPETGDDVIIYGPEDLREYEILKEPGDDPQWAIYGRGEGVTWENHSVNNTGFGDDSNYNPTTPEDVDALFPVSKNNVNFYNVVDEPNADIRTLGTYQAPLDVVVLAGTGNNNAAIAVQVSTDNENWITVGDTIMSTGYQRLWKKYTRSYDGTDEVYVRVAHVLPKYNKMTKCSIYDIYIANQGEKSKELLEQLQDEYTGIEEVQQQTTKVAAGVYNLSGVRQNGLQRGLNIVVEANGTVKKVVVK